MSTSEKYPKSYLKGKRFYSYTYWNVLEESEKCNCSLLEPYESESHFKPKINQFYGQDLYTMRDINVLRKSSFQLRVLLQLSELIQNIYQCWIATEIISGSVWLYWIVAWFSLYIKVLHFRLKLIHNLRKINKCGN